MAARTLYPTQDAGPTNWSVASWSEADDNAKDQAKPTAEDTVIFTANSGAITMDESSAALVAFSIAGGTLVGTGQTLIVAGNVAYTGGTATNITLSMTDDGNLSWDNQGDIIELAIASGKIVTLTGTTWVDKLSGLGTLTRDNQLFRINANANDFWMIAEPSLGTGIVEAHFIGDRTNAASINLGEVGGGTLQAVGGDRKITIGAAVVCTTTTLTGNANNKWGGLTLGATGNSLGIVKLGNQGTGLRSGRLDLGTSAFTANITSIAINDGNNKTDHELDFGDAEITLTGTINGSGVACSGNTAGGISATIHGGTVQNVNMNTSTAYVYLDATDGVTDGGNNSNVLFLDGDGERYIVFLPDLDSYGAEASSQTNYSTEGRINTRSAADGTEHWAIVRILPNWTEVNTIFGTTYRCTFVGTFDLVQAVNNAGHVLNVDRITTEDSWAEDQVCWFGLTAATEWAGGSGSPNGVRHISTTWDHTADTWEVDATTIVNAWDPNIGFTAANRGMRIYQTGTTLTGDFTYVTFESKENTDGEEPVRLIFRQSYGMGVSKIIGGGIW